MNAEFARVVLRSREQWATGVTLGFESGVQGGLVLAPTPIFARWLQLARAASTIEDAGCDGCDRLVWIERRAGRRREALELVVLDAQAAEPLRIDLVELGVRGEVRLLASGESIWLLDRQAERVFGFDARSLQVVRELRTGAQPRDIAVDARGRVFVLHSTRIDLHDGGGRRALELSEPLSAALALALIQDGPRSTLFVSEGTSSALVRLELDGLRAQLSRSYGLALTSAPAFRAHRLLALASGVLAVGADGSGAVFERGGQCCGAFGREQIPLRSMADCGRGRIVAACARGIALFDIDGTACGTRGRFYTRALDSGPRPDRRWQRVDFDMDLPPGIVLEMRHVFSHDAGMRARVDALVDAPHSGAQRASQLELELGGLWSPAQSLVGGPGGGESGLAPERGRPGTACARSLLVRDDEDRPVAAAANTASKPLRYLWLRIDVLQLPGAEAIRGRALPGAQPFGLRALTITRPRLSYLRYLPAIYQAEESSRRFLERFLSAFERDFETLEARVDHMEREFDPALVPASRLPMLAEWLGLELDPQWGEGTARAVLREAPALLGAKGTPASIARLLELVSGARASIVESRSEPQPLRLGTGAALGMNTLIARPRSKAMALGTDALGSAPLGEPDHRPEDATRERAWRARIELDLSGAQLDERRAMLERTLQRSVPAHVAVELTAAAERGTFVVGTRLRAAPRATLGGTTLGTGVLGARGSRTEVEGLQPVCEGMRLQ